MRSAAVLLSNLRSTGPRPAGRAGKARQRDADTGRDRLHRRKIASRQSVGARRPQCAIRSALRRMRPMKQAPLVGFVAVVLH